MTKQQRAMASMVRAIKAGKWTDELPDWAPIGADCALQIIGEESGNILRAVQTAEAFILLLLADNPRFDVTRFVKACGFRS